MSKIKKIGNSLWVLIPSDLSCKYDFKDGTPIKVVDNGCGISIRKQMTPMDAVTVAANVSYRDGPTRDELERIFLTGELPPQFIAHVHRVLTEMSWKIIEDAAKQISDNPLKIIENLKTIGANLEH